MKKNELLRVLMANPQNARIWDQCNSAMYFLNTVAIGHLDSHVSKMRQVLSEDGLDKFPEVLRNVERLNELARRLMQTLYGKTGKNLHVTTWQWMNQWEADYHAECRLCPNMMMLVNKRCSYGIANLEHKAANVSLNVEKCISQSMVRLAMLTATWSGMAVYTTTDIMGMWRKVIGKHHITDSDAINFIQQHKAARKASEAVAHSVAKMEFDDKKIWWRQFADAETSLYNQIVALIKNDSFGDMTIEHMTRDWLDYYIARTVLYCRDNNEELHKGVQGEISELGRWSHEKLLIPFTAMIKTVAQKIGSTQDPWDVTDYLREHQWSIEEKIKELALMRIHTPENSVYN